MTEPMTPPDKQIRFRPIDLTTARALAPLRNDPEVQEHVRNPGLLSDSDQTKWLEWLVVNRNTQRMVAIEACPPESTWRLVGCGGMTHISWIDRRAELSVYTVPDTWEHEAARMLLEWGFDELGLHRIEAETLTPGRAELCRTLGFERDGVRCKAYWRGAEYRSGLLWGLLADEWERA